MLLLVVMLMMNWYYCHYYYSFVVSLYIIHRVGYVVCMKKYVYFWQCLLLFVQFSLQWIIDSDACLFAYYASIKSKAYSL